MTYHARSGRNGPARNHYQEVTDRIVAALDAGTRPWQRPWDPPKAAKTTDRPALQLPFNGATGRRYRGINVLLLLGTSDSPFTGADPRWCTYRQATERGWQVRKGERATTVFFYKRIEIEDRRRGEDDDSTRRIPVLRAYSVFNAAQIDGIPPFRAPTADEAPWRRPEASDVILRNSGASIRIGGDRAFYMLATDHIQLPPDSAFKSGPLWSAVALHELGHWSGAPNRLDRDLSGMFGSATYAKEELRADLASLFIGTTLGIPTDVPHHASYVASWSRILKDERREIFRAAADAQRIADFCLAFHPEYKAAAGNADPDAHDEEQEAPARGADFQDSARAA